MNMRRTSRHWGILGALLFPALIAAFVVSAKWVCFYECKVGGKLFAVGFGLGATFLTVESRRVPGPRGLWCETNPDGIIVIPEVESFPSRWRLWIPVWVPFAAAAVLCVIGCRLSLRKFRAGHCKKCGYNLTGNTSGVCPECGTPSEPRRSCPDKAP